MILPDLPYAHVRVVAPAASVPDWAREEVQGGVALIEGQGFRVSFGRSTFDRHYYFSATDQQRQEDLREALEDEQIDVIWAVRGGYGTVGALAALTSAQVALHPKWLVGYSDITAAHVLWQQAGLLSLHGAMGKGLSNWNDSARDEMFALLAAAQPPTKDFPAQPPTKDFPAQLPTQDFSAQTLFDAGDSGSRAGVLWGGNLTVLASLCGTTQMPPLGAQDTILFLEDNELSYRTHRAAQQLLSCGALRQVQAVVLGQWGGPSFDAQTLSADALQQRSDSMQMLRELFVEHSIPLLAGLPVGHQVNSRPLLLGGWATVNLSDGTVHVEATPAAHDSTPHQTDGLPR